MGSIIVSPSDTVTFPRENGKFIYAQSVFISSPKIAVFQLPGSSVRIADLLLQATTISYVQIVVFQKMLKFKS